MIEAESRGQSIRQLVLGQAEEKIQRSQTYLPENKKNVKKNYQVVRGCIEKLPDKNYQNMGELVVALNRLKGSESFVGVDSVVELGKKRHKILAIFPPGTPMYRAYKDTPGAASFIGGENLWDDSYNKDQIFLPGVYIVGPATSLKE